MTTTQSAAPTLTNVGTSARNKRKLFVNIPVTDLQRSINFFETLGFTFNAQFTDATATSMIVGEDAYFMLLTRDKFDSFSHRPSGDARKETSAMFAFDVSSREEVDRIVKKALAAGGAKAGDAQDHGFMYASSFYDPDGYHWEVFWMDPTTVEG